MRGTRLVKGAFRIATRTADYMTQMVALAAESRSKQQSSYPIRGMDTDETNIQKYWSRNIDPNIELNDYKHLFSSHPPFNFVVVYGIQSTSIVDNPLGRVEEVIAHYGTDTPLMSDVNERLVESDPGGKMRFIIEAVDLTSMQIEYGPEGDVCSEIYSFFARDIYNS
jgi:hypothetical protein